MNKVILRGNLAGDPELRYIPNGTVVATLTLAVNRKYKQGEETKQEVCFIDVVVWAKPAEACKEYLSKGSAILVEGRLQQWTWEAEDGSKRSKHEVVSEQVIFLDRKVSGDGD